ncbi:MAG: hypothetical protein LBG83_08005 [Oscillospiraceae bacterium]|jgi:hypothetical protein|nr:hypothetical protein [Oscillospiraceae bacterium]
MNVPKLKPKGIAAIAAGALALAAVVIFLILRGGTGAQADDFAVLYAKGSQNIYLATPDGQFALRAKETRQQWFSPDGAYLYYDAVTDDSEGSTIYLCLLGQSDSRKEGGKAIAKGAGNWAAAGGYAVYVEGKARRLQCYNAARETTQELASGLEELYAACGQSAFFFTKREGDEAVLFRCVMGQRPERMAANVEDLHFFADETQAMLWYQSLSPAGAPALYAMGATGGAALITEEPVKVFFEDYRLGGNLYFLKRGQTAQPLTVTVEDRQQESDAALKKPEESDYLVTFFGRFGRRLFGDGGYSTALAQYNEKLERDKVRASVKAALEELPDGFTAMDCCVYDGVSERLLATGISESGLAAMRPMDRPAAVFKRERMDESDPTRTVALDVLVTIYRNGGDQAVREALTALMTREGTEDLSYSLAMLQGDDKPSEVPLEQSFGQNEFYVLFPPGQERMLYLDRGAAGANGALYSYDLMNYGVSERRLADTDVTDILLSDDVLYYRKQSPDKHSTLSAYIDGKTVRLMNNADAYFVGRDGMAFAICNVKDDAGTLYAMAPDGKNQPILLAEQVRVGSAKAGGHAAWLAHWREGSGELQTGRKAAKTLDVGVTEILKSR